jgi:phenylalanyl-tRNA synthetase beta subunit
VLAKAPSIYEVKQTLVYLVECIGLELKIEEPKEEIDHFILGRFAEIKIKDKKSVISRDLHKFEGNWKMKMPVSLFERKLKIFKA